MLLKLIVLRGIVLANDNVYNKVIYKKQIPICLPE